MDGTQKTSLDGKDANGSPTSSTTLTTSLGSTQVKDPATGMTITVPYIDVSAGSLKTFSSDNPYLLICIRNARPVGYSLGELCLASRDTASSTWVVVDEDVLLATGNQICGWTPHLTQFAILPKMLVMNMATVNTNAVGTAMPLAIDESSQRNSSSGGFATWKIVVIVIAAVVCCLILLLLIFCLVRRSGGGKPKQQRRRGVVKSSSEDDDMQVLEVYDDKSVTNPAFARVSAREMDSTRDGESTMVARGNKPPTLRRDETLDSRGGEATMPARKGPGTMTRTREDDRFKSTIFNAEESSDDDRAVPTRTSNAELDMDSYQTLRKEVVEDDNKGQSIIDMSTYKTLTKEPAGGRADSAIDAAIFEALETSSSE